MFGMISQAAPNVCTYMYRESGLVSDLLKKIASDRLYKGVLDEAT